MDTGYTATVSEWKEAYELFLEEYYRDIMEAEDFSEDDCAHQIDGLYNLQLLRTKRARK